MKNILSFHSVKYIILLLFISSSFIIEAQVWEQVQNSPFRDDHTNGFGFEDKAYVFRGIPTTSSGAEANEVWTYTPATDEWDLLTVFPGDPRRISIGDDWNGKYYYGFGIGGPDGLLNDLWEFDPVDESFTQLPSCPCVGRSHPSLIAHNDKIFMGAGSSFGGDLNDWWEYDMITQVWTQKPNIPGAVRHHMFHFSSGDYVYVGGGHVFNWNRYDPLTEEWTPIDDLPQGRVAGTQFNYKGLGFILAGDDFTHTHVPNFETFMYYSPESGEWDYLPPLPNGSRWAPSSFIVEEQLYFAAGLSDLINGDATMWKFDLSMIDCLPPSGLNAIDITNTSAGLFWGTNASSDSDTLKWRKVGESVWNEVINANAVYQLENLEVCQDYEFTIAIECGTMGASSDVYTFKTDGCCINPEIAIKDVTGNSALVEWADISAAEEYNVRWRQMETADWNAASVNSSPFELTGLDGCTRYEFQIESICTTDDIDFSESTTFITSDCGACLDVEYCKVEGIFDTEFNYINKIEINGFENESGKNGYGNFDGALAEDIRIGETFTFSFEPGYDFGPFAVDLLVWIDLNSNGSFEDDEQVVKENGVINDLTREILIPATATPGLTRMRVYFANIADPCLTGSTNIFGEGEDYCLNLLEQVNSVSGLASTANTFEVFPNPFQNKFVLKDQLGGVEPYDIRIMNFAGESVFSQKGYKLNEALELPIDMASGVYILRAENEKGSNEIKIVKL